jgi:hypothetical protein
MGKLYRTKGSETKLMARLRRTSPKYLRKAEIAYDALSLRKAGLQYREISNTLSKKYNMPITLSYCYRAVMDSLTQLSEETQEVAEQMRRLDEMRLGDSIRAIYPAVLNGNFQAIDRLVKIVERRAKMYGYDAPTSVSVSMPEPILFVCENEENKSN